MPGQLGLGSQHVARAKADERIDFDPPALDLEQEQPCAIGCLEALPAGDSGVVDLDRCGEWTKLANLTAAIRIGHDFSGSSCAMVSAFGPVTMTFGQPEESLSR
jgi:hypothetical protein